MNETDRSKVTLALAIQLIPMREDQMDTVIGIVGKYIDNKSYPNHMGRPGMRGGSLPRGGTSAGGGGEEEAARIGISPYRSSKWGKGTAQSSIEFQKRNGEMSKQKLLDSYKKYGVTDDVEKTLGLWDSTEPSLNSNAHGSKENIIKAACDYGNTHDQDGVAILFPNKAGLSSKHTWTFSKPLSVKQSNKIIDKMTSREDDDKLFVTFHTDSEGRLSSIEHWDDDWSRSQGLPTKLRGWMIANKVRSKYKMSEKKYDLVFINNEDKDSPHYSDYLGKDYVTKSKGSALNDYL